MSSTTLPSRTPDYPIDPMYLRRWSPRAMSDDPITEAELYGMLEAARWAPSCLNAQPWRFVVALRGEPGFENIAATLLGPSPFWAPKAAALIVFASYSQIVMPDGRQVSSAWNAFDTGSAWMCFALEALRQGWHTHALGGFDGEALARAVNLPPDHAIHAVVAIGRRGDPAALPDALRAREQPSGRRTLADSVVREGFPAL